MRERFARVLLVLLTAAACGKKAAMSTPPADDDPLSGYEAELAQNAQALAALGVTVPPAEQRLETDQPGTKFGDTDDVPKPEPEATDPTKPSGDVGKQVTTTPNTEPTTATPVRPSANPVTTSTDSAEGCGRICSLAEVACDLSGRICGLAMRHVGDARYEDACWNAERQCEAASDACSDCDPDAGACGDDE